MSKTITAIFQARRSFETALRRLEKIDVTDKQIGVVMSDETHGKSFKIETHSRADEGMAAGVTFGGVMGGILTALAGVGTLTIPGLNLVVAGSIVSGLAGAAVGATAGGIVGILVGMGVSEHEAKLYEGKFKTGHIMLAVIARDDKQAIQVRDVLKEAGAYNIAA